MDPLFGPPLITPVFSFQPPLNERVRSFDDPLRADVSSSSSSILRKLAFERAVLVRGRKVFVLNHHHNSPFSATAAFLAAASASHFPSSACRKLAFEREPPFRGRGVSVLNHHHNSPFLTTAAFLAAAPHFPSLAELLDALQETKPRGSPSFLNPSPSVGPTSLKARKLEPQKPASDFPGLDTVPVLSLSASGFLNGLGVTYLDSSSSSEEGGEERFFPSTSDVPSPFPYTAHSPPPATAQSPVEVAAVQVLARSLMPPMPTPQMESLGSDLPPSKRLF